ncbi:MAG: twin-arginine translocase subunit TatC [Thermobacillus sp.]|jgi:sec-independent protein translocase protein TatC|uniref:Sec-independent protein translocase protein TatC n=2 Tax=Thermobacillus TaxID=76632 RepID=L0ECM2_THECK|nr:MULTISPECIES: twin-arginine translocase subunit TatC [Thermobacillus]AGA57552.1 twin arginine targeting protein translocase subunit TatC [Thermobacillus composti KWC4]REK59456.1 MAG: twin-arginine translocase subunit TatC [Thermobacillus sp.]CAG5088227.1 Twin arginine-targeting protein translocase TatC [Thermobacillus xylanilyticus]
MSGRQDPNSMSVIGHLGELRTRLIRTLLSFLASMAAAFLYVRDLYDWLVRGLDDKLVVLGPSDVLWVYLLLSGVAALTVTMPVAAWHAWRFVSPALGGRVRRRTAFYIPALALLFLAGLAFGYFVLFPVMLDFMNRMAAEQFETLYTAQKYFTFMIHMTVPFGFLFELPAALLFLTRIGVLNPARLARMRKSAYFILVIVAVSITPPDIVSDIIVIVPLLLLYEVSVALSKAASRRAEPAGAR